MNLIVEFGLQPRNAVDMFRDGGAGGMRVLSRTFMETGLKSDRRLSELSCVPSLCDTE